MEFTAFHSSSKGNLYTIRSGEKTLLIEAGVPVAEIKKALGYRLSEVSGCLISHSHKDHAKGMLDVMCAGVDCYATAETAEAVGATGHRYHRIIPLETFAIDGTWKCLPFGTQHDCPGSVGFLVSDNKDKLLFATDTYYIKYRFKGLTIISVECNYSKETLSPDLDPAVKKRLLTSHFSLENVLKFLAANDLTKVREIFLLHLSSDNSDEEMFKAEVQRLTGVPVYVCGV